MDIGSAVSRAKGVREEQILELADYETSAEFDARERVVIDYATALAQTPANVSNALFVALHEHLDDAQIVELTAAIAWEHFRARFNRGLDIGPDGFSEGSVCAIPVRDAAQA